MPTSADLLLDTSVAVPFVLEDLPQHPAVARRVGSSALGLAGHACYETYSVLTRLPPPLRVSPTVAGRILAETFPATWHLADTPAALRRLAAAGVAGGAVYDGLVAIAADEAGTPLLTRDARALPTYRALGVAVELLA